MEESTLRVSPTTSVSSMPYSLEVPSMKVLKNLCLDVANTHLLQRLIVQNVLSTCALVDVYFLHKYVKQGSIFYYSNLCILLLFSGIQFLKIIFFSSKYGNRGLLFILSISPAIHNCIAKVENISEYRHPYGCLIFPFYPNLIPTSLIPTHSLLIVHTQASSRMSN